MAFKIISSETQISVNPKELLKNLTRRSPSIQALYGYQEKLLDEYSNRAVDKTNVILQLPTGSGKTLVALLIAEWRRRKYKEKILYLCPTNQLVSQVCKQAKTYGIDVVSFTGKKDNYQQSDLNKFITSEAIAVTNYSSLFNINPQFKNADVIFCDDAHSADQYISSMWTLNISKSDDKEAFDQIINIIKNSLSESSQSVLTNTNNSYRDVDHLPIPYLYGYEEDLTQYLDSYCEDKKPLRFSWNTIREHLSTCLFFYSSDSIQIKPLISPTWTHKPFTEAKQRVYISATLSFGGDLERCFGITECESLSHEDYTESGVGRHLFMFPQMLKTTEDQESLEISLIKEAGRSIYLSPSENRSEKIHTELSSLQNTGFQIFTNIEKDKELFTSSSKAIAILTNRYDGIDFPNEDCRLMFIDGKPQATNLQERFLIHRFSASSLYNERIQIRLLQALGRCTRSSNDFACVVIKDQDVFDYLADPNKRKFLDTKIQAEIEFGLDQKDASIKDYIDNFSLLKANEREWEEATNNILTKANSLQQENRQELEELKSIAKLEITFQKKLWSRDYKEALVQTKNILGVLKNSELKGYRATWNYFAGVSSWLLHAQSGDSQILECSRSYFTEAKNIAIGVDWLIKLSSDDNNQDTISNDLAMAQVLKIEDTITKLGIMHDGNFIPEYKLLQKVLQILRPLKMPIKN